MKNIVVIFINRIASKNKIQIDSINKKGRIAWVFAPDSSASHMNVLRGNQIEKLPKSGLERTKNIYLFFSANYQEIHHIEIYPGGRFTFIYLILAKLFQIKVICAERGDLLYYKNKLEGGYDYFTKFSMRLCYRFSDIVWYREPYMKKRLHEIGAKNLFFLHNAIPLTSNNVVSIENKEIDFLWVNRIIPERKAEWWVEILNAAVFKDTKNVLLGLLKGGGYELLEKELIEKASSNLMFYDYANPLEFYLKSKFFVLPASIVFANFSLLEAMSNGVVPIVSDSQGSELLIEDGVNGFVFPHSKEGLQQAMMKALKLSPEEYSILSKNATETIKKRFSEDYYEKELEILYKKIES